MEYGKGLTPPKMQRLLRLVRKNRTENGIACEGK